MHDKVELAPMPPCPVPFDVWSSLRRIDPTSGPILARPVDSTTFNLYADRLYNNRTTGSDCKPREYCKYGPPVLRELYREALNARLAGKHPTVGIEDRGNRGVGRGDSLPST